MNPIGEFELIERYFKSHTATQKKQIELGIGDDCAIFSPSVGKSIAVSTDLLVEGRHFLSTISPERLGHRALAVNLSDLAAMGAKPLAFTLSLSLPKIDEKWCEAFSKGLFKLADYHQCASIGGDITAGPLTISITIFGEIDPALALRRDGAKTGDDIYLSHSLLEGIGAARLCFEALSGRAELKGNDFNLALLAMEKPTPRVGLGLALQGVATSAIDLSDGLLGDLSHILKQSKVGARIEVDNIPRSAVLHQQPTEIQRLCILSGGDDYELLFTAPMHQRANILKIAHQQQTAVTMIGKIEAQSGIRLFNAIGQHVPNTYHSFEHFRSI